MLLAVSPFRNTNKDEERGGEMSMSMSMFSSSETTNDFVGDFDEDDASLLESINFDDIFVGIDVDADDILPDLEMDPEIFAAFSDVTAAASSSVSPESNDNKHVADVAGEAAKKEDEDKMSSASGSGSESGQSSGREECAVVKASRKEGDRGRKSSAQSSSKNNNSQGKRKVKVDWTPELHRRFVQAVEQLGVDKAVPSRILEIMGIDCLTRHNIASHLQKYRSHRKHLLAREAEAANWSKRRHHHQSTTLTTYGVKRESPSPSPSSGPGPWAAATIGFPPPMHHFRPLHVWGHPTMDHSFMPLWPPKHSPASPSYWHPQRGPNTLTPGTPCFPQPLTASTTRLPTQPAVPGIPPPHAMYKVDPSGVAVPAGQSGPRPLIDFHPSKESIDAAIGDVLSKPSLPLPLGLKAPSLDIVMGELQRQGIPKIPPSCA